MIDINSYLKTKIINPHVKPKVLIQIGDDLNPLTNGNLFLSTVEITEVSGRVWLGIVKAPPKLTHSIPDSSGVVRGNKFSFDIYDISKVWETLQDPAQVTMILKGLGGDGYIPVSGFGEGGFIKEAKYLSQKLLSDLVDEIEDKPVYVYVLFQDELTYEIPHSHTTLLIKKGIVKDIIVKNGSISIECLNSILEFNRGVPYLEHKLETLAQLGAVKAVPKKSESESVPTIYGRGFFPLKWIDAESDATGQVKYPTIVDPDSDCTLDKGVAGEDWILANSNFPDVITFNRNTDFYIGDVVEIRTVQAGYDSWRTLGIIKSYNGSTEITLQETFSDLVYNSTSELFEELDLDKYRVVVTNGLLTAKGQLILSAEVKNVAGVLFYGENQNKNLPHDRELQLQLMYDGRPFSLGDAIPNYLAEKKLVYDLPIEPDFPSFSNIKSRLNGVKIDLSTEMEEEKDTEFPYRIKRKFNISVYPYKYSKMPVKVFYRGGACRVKANPILKEDYGTFQIGGNYTNYLRPIMQEGMYLPYKFAKNDSYYKSKFDWLTSNADAYGWTFFKDKESFMDYLNQDINTAEFSFMSNCSTIAEEINLGESFFWLLDESQALGSNRVGNGCSKAIDYIGTRDKYLAGYSPADGFDSSVQIVYRAEYLEENKMSIYNNDAFTYNKYCDSLGRWQIGEKGSYRKDFSFDVDENPNSETDTPELETQYSDYYFRRIGNAKAGLRYGVYGNAISYCIEPDRYFDIVDEVDINSIQEISEIGSLMAYQHQLIRNAVFDNETVIRGETMVKTHTITNPHAFINRDREDFTAITIDGSNQELGRVMAYVQFPNIEDGNRWAKFLEEFDIDSLDRFIASISCTANGRMKDTKVLDEVSNYLDFDASAESIGTKKGTDLSGLATWKREVKVSPDGRLLANWQTGSLKYPFKKAVWFGDDEGGIYPSSWGEPIEDLYFTDHRQEASWVSELQSLYFADSGESDLIDGSLNEAEYDSHINNNISIDGHIGETASDDHIPKGAKSYFSNVVDFNGGTEGVAVVNQLVARSPYGSLATAHYCRLAYIRDKLGIESIEDLSGLCIGVIMESHQKPVVNGYDDVLATPYTEFANAPYLMSNSIHNIKLNTMQFIGEIAPSVSSVENKFIKYVTGQPMRVGQPNYPDLTQVSPPNTLDLKTSGSYFTLENLWGSKPYDGEGVLKYYVKNITQAQITPFLFGDNLVCIKLGTYGMSSERNVIAKVQYDTSYIGSGDTPDKILYIGQLGTEINWTDNDNGSEFWYSKIDLVELENSDRIATEQVIIEKPQDILYDIIENYCHNVALLDWAKYIDINNVIPVNSWDSGEDKYKITPYNLKYSLEEAKVLDVLKDLTLSSNTRVIFNSANELKMIGVNNLDSSVLTEDLSTVDGTPLDKLIAGEIRINRTKDNYTYNRIEVYYNYDYIDKRYRSYVILDGKSSRVLKNNSNTDYAMSRLTSAQSFDVSVIENDTRQDFDSVTEQNILSELHQNFLHYKKEVKPLTIKLKGVKNYIDAWHIAIFKGKTFSNKRYVIKFPMTQGAMFWEAGDLIKFKEGEAGELTKANIDNLTYEIINIEKSLDIDSFFCNITAHQLIL